MTQESLISACGGVPPLTRQSRQYPASFSAAFYSTLAINGISAEILQEKMTWMALLGGALTLLGLYISELKPKPKSKEERIYRRDASFCPTFATYE